MPTQRRITSWSPGYIPDQTCDGCAAPIDNNTRVKFWGEFYCPTCASELGVQPPTTTYRGHTVTILEDGRWRFGPLTFETPDDCKRYMNHLPRKGTTP